MNPFSQLLIQWIGMVCHTLLEASSEWEHVGDVSSVVDVLRRDNRTEVIVTATITCAVSAGCSNTGLTRTVSRVLGRYVDITDIVDYFRYCRYIIIIIIDYCRYLPGEHVHDEAPEDCPDQEQEVVVVQSGHGEHFALPFALH